MKSATKITAAVMGTITGLAGIEHGIGEILQGSVAPERWMIQSWPDSAAMKIVNGEPAMTMVPNLLATGALAVLFSLAFLAWATMATRRRYYGPALMLLCIPMLLCGAGFGPPLLGLIIGGAVTRESAGARAAGSKRLAPRPGSPGALLGRLWPWSLGACLATWLAMLPGLPLLYHFWGIGDTSLVLVIILAMFALLFLTIVTGAARDRQNMAAAG
jgi:hypothetical protein